MDVVLEILVGEAITCDNTYYPPKNGLLVSNCNIFHCGVGINIAYISEYNRFTTTLVQDCSYGVINNGGNNTFVNCDFSKNAIGVYFNGGDEKAIRYNGTTVTGNTAHGIILGCTINHSEFQGNDNPGYAIVYIDTIGKFLFREFNLLTEKSI